MEQIFRVENDKGEGPYRAEEDTGTGWMDSDHNEDDPRRPRPKYDGLAELWQQTEHFEGAPLFGFASMEQMHQWFSEQELQRLYAIGFHVDKVESCRTLLGGHQLVFDGGCAKTVQMFSLAEL